jgi:hypothetical protein
VKVPRKGIHRNTRGRLSMEGLSMVFKDKLIESACRDGLVADHNEQGEAHERGKTMITKNHNTGSKKCYEKWSQDRLDKRLAEIELQLEIFEELLQRNGEDQRYGWILPKKVKWHTLQVKLKDRFNTKVRGALRTIEYEDMGCICEPEHGQILGEDEGFAGVKNEGQLSKTVMKIEGDGNMFSKPTEEEHGQNLVTRKSETILSTTDNKHEELNAMTEGHNEGEHVKHKDAVLEEARREILLLENLLKKSESNWNLGLQVEKLCFNNLDEEMKYFEEHMGNYEGIKDSVEVLSNSKHENDMEEKDIFQGIPEVKVAAISTAMCEAAFVQEDDNRGQLLNIVWKFENNEESNNSKFVIQQKEKVLEVLITSRQMKVEMEKGIQTELFQQRSRLDEEIDILWHLMQRCRKNYDSEVQAVIWMTEGDCEVHYRNSGQQQLQNKVWDPGRLKITVT